MKKVAIFGSTGSIGQSTLEVINRNQDIFQANTLVAGKNIERLKEQIAKFHPEHVYIIEKEHAKEIKERYPKLDVQWRKRRYG